jgi:hypothetical protein
MRRCKHPEWVDLNFAYTLPVVDFEAERITVALAEKMLMGVTTVTQRCTQCGLISARNFNGKVSPGAS